MKRLDKCNKIYQSLKISQRLDDTIKESINQAKVKKTFHIYKPVLTFAASFCIAFVVLLNVNEAFAKAAYNIPVIGKIAEVFTVREYQEEKDDELIRVKTPALANTGNSELETRINREISKKVDGLLKESKKVAEEFKQGMEEAKNEVGVTYFTPIEIAIDYEVKKSDENLVSFVISKSESFYSFYEERYYYNIDLKTGKDITLEKLFGANYKEYINKEIEKQIKEKQKEDDNVVFYDIEDEVLLEHGFSFSTISDDQGFYINEKGNVVIAFPKYSIAPGYMGIVEFEIIK